MTGGRPVAVARKADDLRVALGLGRQGALEVEQLDPGNLLGQTA